MGIKIVYAYNRAEEVSKLFTEYTAMLIEKDSSFQKYLDIQNYSEEMEHLENKYCLPDGRLYLVYCDEKLAGCIGLRKIDSQNCEMKRLYIRPVSYTHLDVYKRQGKWMYLIFYCFLDRT